MASILEIIAPCLLTMEQVPSGVSGRPWGATAVGPPSSWVPNYSGSRLVRHPATLGSRLGLPPRHQGSRGHDCWGPPGHPLGASSSWDNPSPSPPCPHPPPLRRCCWSGIVQGCQRGQTGCTLQTPIQPPKKHARIRPVFPVTPRTTRGFWATYDWLTARSVLGGVGAPSPLTSRGLGSTTGVERLFHRKMFHVLAPPKFTPKFAKVDPKTGGS